MIRNNNQSQKEKDEQGRIIKEAVKATFEKLSNIESSLFRCQKIKSALKRDLNDLSEGRLDRILERQEMDEVSKEEGAFNIILKVEIGSKTTSPWYIPYLLSFKDKDGQEVNNSVSKTYAKGTYKLENGEIKYL